MPSGRTTGITVMNVRKNILDIGYNKFDLSTPIKYPAGSVIHLSLTSAKLAVDTISKGYYNDYDSPIGFSLNANSPRALFVNLIIEKSAPENQSTQESFQLSKVYSVDGTFALHKPN